MRLRLAAVSMGLLFATVPATGAPRRMYLDEAVSYALAHHPALATARARTIRAAQAAPVARAESLPHISVGAELLRGTSNAVPGVFFPQSSMPPIAGPPQPTRFDSGTWQSGAGVGATWDLLSLVRTPRTVSAADASVTEARSTTELTRLSVALNAADTFLLAVEAKKGVSAMQANEERAKTLVRIATALVEKELRPELEQMRATSELATATALLDRSETELSNRRVALAQALGDASLDVDPVSGDLETLPADPTDFSPSREHPLLVASRAAERSSEAEQDVVRLGYLPRVELVGAAWLRGSGVVVPNGPNSGRAGGTVPDTPNWVAGVVGSWSLTDSAITDARSEAARAETAVARTRVGEARLELDTEMATARAAIRGARRVSASYGAALKQAVKAEEVATTRYQTGLATLVDVADAMRVRAAAERDDAVARIEVRRALLLYYRARGSYDPLLDRAIRARR